MQRAAGAVSVAMRSRNGTTRLEKLFQSGCAKAILPKTHGATPEVVLVNTSGGITGGDRLEWSLACGDGATLTATTQAAERIYRASAGTARIATHLTLGEASRIDWLPQETIFFDGGSFDRRMDVNMPGSATFLGIETLVMGRAAMGETVTHGHLRDVWNIHRDGRLVHAEAFRASGDLAAAFSGPATLSGARALTTLVHVAPVADERIEAARALLVPEPGVVAAATSKPGILIVRFLAGDAAPLRRSLIRFLMAFRGSPMPRVWSL